MSDGDKLELARVVECTRVMIRPMNERKGKDLAIFMHCAGGLISVFEDYFNRDVKPVLELHGVEYEIINQGGG